MRTSKRSSGDVSDWLSVHCTLLPLAHSTRSTYIQQRDPAPALLWKLDEVLDDGNVVVEDGPM
jgi:hypothetical protein